MRFRVRALAVKNIVSFEEDPGALLLSVSDNGGGMPVGKKRGRPGPGTGIVEALSRQLDATVTVVETNPGTRVEVRRGHAEAGT